MAPLAHHIIYSAYGFWLPNDPRGSGSKWVGSERLFERFGPATKVTTKGSVARRTHDHAQRLAAKRELAYPPVTFTGRQAREVALAIGDVGKTKRLAIYACAIMPDHVHFVVRSSRFTPAQLVAACRAQASRRLHDAGLWATARPIWGRGRWVVHLDTANDVQSRIRYVNQNPVKAGLSSQRWSFVQKFP
jgi:REP element-mobilizing transposase RayT